MVLPHTPPSFYFCKPNHTSKLSMVSYGSLVKLLKETCPRLVGSLPFIFYSVIQEGVWTLLRYSLCFRDLGFFLFHALSLKFIIFNNGESVLVHSAELTELGCLMLESGYLRLSPKSTLHCLKL